MSWETAASWVSRLMDDEEFRRPYDNPQMLEIIDDKVRRYGTLCYDVGKDGVGEDEVGVHHIVITQSARFKGYKNMVPNLIPQFQGSWQEASLCATGFIKRCVSTSRPPLCGFCAVQPVLFYGTNCSESVGSIL